MIQLLIGGVRSGKSAAAEKLLGDLIEQTPSSTAYYIATSLNNDTESQLRIQQHQQQRDLRFKQKINTIELDYQSNHLVPSLEELDQPGNVILVECLTTWVAWYLTQDAKLTENLQHLQKRQRELLNFLNQVKCHIIIVSGEVGCGLIGETVLQRRYADSLGKLNQKVASIANSVFLLTAGISQQIK